ncbi:MAG: 4-alpha-glucanotransferase [Myxococcota bacterium]
MGVVKLGVRSSGILLHPTSLPGGLGCGDIGPSARAFVDWLQRAGQRWWQMLPVGPVGYGNSPYSALSALAGNPLLISMEDLAEDGFLTSSEVQSAAPPVTTRVGYPVANRVKSELLHRAYGALSQQSASTRKDFETFRVANAHWLPDYALYRAVKASQREVQWTLWPAELRDRDPAALARARTAMAEDILFREFEQWIFARQWERLRRHCTSRGVGLVGDIPIFVAHDSADVWQHRDLFRLGPDGSPTVVAGVPPDYFSATGQRWGNPLYRWKHLRAQGYAWWIERFRITLHRFDAVRLDHFIGFTRYWEIPADEPTAVRGRWMKGPGAPFFRAVRDELGTLPLIAEDLGAVTPAVKALRDRFHLPGIKILQFAFGTDPSAPDFKPHNYPRRAVVYTGTHDNDTTVGWFHDVGGSGTRSPEQTEKERQACLRYIGSDGRRIHWDMIRTAMASVAATAIFPMQDVLGLGTEARMNLPGVAEGNWEWRMDANSTTDALAEALRLTTATYDRI